MFDKLHWHQTNDHWECDDFSGLILSVSKFSNASKKSPIFLWEFYIGFDRDGTCLIEENGFRDILEEAKEAAINALKGWAKQFLPLFEEPNYNLELCN